MPEGADIQQSRREYVERFLERPHFHLTGIDLKVFSALGDEVAAIALSWFRKDRILDDLTLRKVLTAVSASLEYPGDVQDHSKRVPHATRILLECLLNAASSEAQREAVRATGEIIEERVAGSPPA